MNHSVFDEFELLAETVLEGEASREEIARFNELIREFPDLFSVYAEQLQMHLTLQFRCGRGDSLESVHCDVRKSERQNVTGKKIWWRSLWKIAAAAAAILMTGAAMWYAAEISTACARFGTEIKTQTGAVLPAIRVVSQRGVKGLDMPETLPGTLRLESGEVAVRLQTGVELTLVGPASMTVQSGICVGLDQGSLLANVPHWATGFTVLTRELEVCDLGTVFSVAREKDITDVFVFKGRVQVSEGGYIGWCQKTTRPAVGICEAGEGVRAIFGERPAKIATDWPEARILFGAVQAGRAFRNPAKALATATRIADLWTARYMPGSNLVAKKMRTGDGIPFQNTAWVRATVPQQEENNMNRTSAAAVLTAAAVAMGAGSSGAVSEPVRVNTSPIENRNWETIFTNEVNIAWRWDNTNAVNAELSVSDIGGEVLVTNVSRSVSNILWRAFAAAVPSAEDVYGLTLTFYNSDSAVVGVQTSRLAVVKGAFGNTTVDPAPAGMSWGRVRGNVVIPYDVGWTEATADAGSSRLVIAKVGGTVQTNTLAAAAGYYGWKLMHSDWGFGTFNLALTFPGAEGEWNASVTRLADGTMILMR